MISGLLSGEVGAGKEGGGEWGEERIEVVGRFLPSTTAKLVVKEISKALRCGPFFFFFWQ